MTSFCEITLTAKKTATGFVVFDANSKRICKVPYAFARKIDCEKIQEMIVEDQWNLAICGMLGAKHAFNVRRKQSDWDNKIEVWKKSMNWRNNRTRQKKPPGRKYSPRNLRETWGEAAMCMASLLKQRLSKQTLREENPWVLWAETVGANLRMRRRFIEHRKNGDKEKFVAEVGIAAIQMCFDWRTHDSATVFS